MAVALVGNFIWNYHSGSFCLSLTVIVASHFETSWDFRAEVLLFDSATRALDRAFFLAFCHENVRLLEWMAEKNTGMSACHQSGTLHFTREWIALFTLRQPADFSARKFQGHSLAMALDPHSFRASRAISSMKSQNTWMAAWLLEGAQWSAIITRDIKLQKNFPIFNTGFDTM
jgi:hypothetical protein